VSKEPNQIWREERLTSQLPTFAPLNLISPRVDKENVHKSEMSPMWKVPNQIWKGLISWLPMFAPLNLVLSNNTKTKKRTYIHLRSPMWKEPNQIWKGPQIMAAHVRSDVHSSHGCPCSPCERSPICKEASEISKARHIVATRLRFTHPYYKA